MLVMAMVWPCGPTRLPDQRGVHGSRLRALQVTLVCRDENHLIGPQIQKRSGMRWAFGQV